MPRLPVLHILKEAFWQMWGHRVVMFKVLIIPVCVMSILQTIEVDEPHVISARKFSMTLVISAVFAIFGVTCHRIILLGPDRVTLLGALQWKRRELRFFLWGFGVFGLALLAIIPGAIAFDYLFDPTDVDRISYWVCWICLLPPGMYVLGRLSLVFPMVALEREFKLREVWHLSNGNGFPLLVLISLLPLLLGQAQFHLKPPNPSIPSKLLFSLLSFVLAAYEIVILSLSYKFLTQQRDSSLRSE